MPKSRRRNAAVARVGAAAAKIARNGRRGRRANRADCLNDIVTRYVDGLVNAVRDEVRRQVSDDVRGFLSSGALNITRAGLVVGRGRRGGAPGKRKIVQCIAPGRANPSKGPRFHYLCDKHKDAKKAEYEAWRKAKREKAAA